MGYCEGKRKYPTSAQAWEAVRSLKAAGGDHKSRAKQLNVYLCERCRYWHVGHLHKKASQQQPKPVKQPTPGQLARKERKAAEREAHRAARQIIFADYIENLGICKILIDRELARYAASGIKPLSSGNNKLS